MALDVYRGADRYTCEVVTPAGFENRGDGSAEAKL